MKGSRLESRPQRICRRFPGVTLGRSPTGERFWEVVGPRTETAERTTAELRWTAKRRDRMESDGRATAPRRGRNARRLMYGGCGARGQRGKRSESPRRLLHAGAICVLTLLRDGGRGGSACRVVFGWRESVWSRLRGVRVGVDGARHVADEAELGPEEEPGERADGDEEDKAAAGVATAAGVGPRMQGRGGLGQRSTGRAHDRVFPA